MPTSLRASLFCLSYSPFTNLVNSGCVSLLLRCLLPLVFLQILSPGNVLSLKKILTSKCWSTEQQRNNYYEANRVCMNFITSLQAYIRTLKHGWSDYSDWVANVLIWILAFFQTSTAMNTKSLMQYHLTTGLKKAPYFHWGKPIAKSPSIPKNLLVTPTWLNQTCKRIQLILNLSSKPI